MKLEFNNRFLKELPSDKVIGSYRRQVVDACFSYVDPKPTKAPKLIHYSEELLAVLGITKEDAESQYFLEVFTGNKVATNSHPYAMCYGGHQFGHWAGQLGDGRAINLFELKHEDITWAVQLKGAGETPYSRKADGLAVLRSSIREYLCSEAMFYLGIPTTRALSLSLTGDEVLRDMLYDGNPKNEKGAVVCRVAETFIRFGSFEILAANENVIGLKQLADHTIRHFYPEIKATGKQKYLDLLISVRDKTIDMIVNWSRVGFVHGVMNTDNMSILGLTIDYGPYGWLDDYDFGFTPNTTDAQHKRYRFGNQAYVGMWNLLKLANALYPLIEESEPLQKIVDEYHDLYKKEYYKMMFSKLGLSSDTSTTIIKDLEEVLHLFATDYTIFFRCLATVHKTDSVTTSLKKLNTAFYNNKLLKGTELSRWELWLEKYLECIQKENAKDGERLIAMNKINPKYIFRNYMAQLAIDAAENGNYTLIDELYQLLKNPYEEQESKEKWFSKRPDWAKDKIGCSMLSCSS